MDDGIGHRRRHQLTRAVALIVFILTACGAFPEPPVVGVISSTAELGGAACPLLLTGGDGSKWEVTLEAPYNISFDPNSGAVVSEGAVPIARTGERIRIEVVESRSEPSACRWGTPVVATEVSRAP